MDNKVFYNAPCELYKDCLRSDRDFKQTLRDILSFVLYDNCKKPEKRVSDADLAKVARKLGVEYNDPIRSWREGKKLYSEHVESARNAPAYFSISRETYWHFMNEESTEFERAMLLAYLAVKSMVGKRDMIKTNMTAICSRMDGNTKPRRKGQLTDGVAKYLNRYWSNRLLSALYEKRGVTFYGGNSSHKVRGFYCSTTLTMEELIIKAEANMEAARSRPADPLREAKRLALSKLHMNSP